MAGFRRGQSVINSVADVITAVQELSDQKNMSLDVFLDSKEANENFEQEVTLLITLKKY